MTANTNEDAAAVARIETSDIDSETVYTSAASRPAHGTVVVQPDGSFTYTPDANYNGTDQFLVRASDGHLESELVSISINIAPVNDAPDLPAFPSLTNSAETLRSTIALPLQDIDGDALNFMAVSANPQTATVTVDAGTRQLLVTPLNYGTTAITITATDGLLSDTTVFGFSVEDVTKRRTLAAPFNNERAIRIANTSSAAVEVELQHNENKLEASIESMLASVRSMPDEFPAEPIERKLWRYVRDNVYHDWSLSYQKFTKDPLLLVNSVGWGLCGDVAIAYMHLARAAGLQARVWYLEGHVVPEVFGAGKWSVYDPDLALYYETPGGSVASVAELAANPSLISTPIEAMFDDQQWFVGTSDYVAGIYSSTLDNALADTVVPYLVVPLDHQSGRLKLPPGASVSYPGRWTPAATGQIDFNNVRTPVATYANMKLQLPANYAGTIELPLQIAQISGNGQIRLDGQQYQLGSSSLSARLDKPTTETRTLEIIQSTGEVAVYFYINPLRFVRKSSDMLALKGKDVWALSVVEEPVTVGDRIDSQQITSVRKPSSAPSTAGTAGIFDRTVSRSSSRL